MFTDFLLYTSLAVIAALAGLLAIRWRSGPGEPLASLRPALGPVAVAAVTAGLVALGFMVI